MLRVGVVTARSGDGVLDFARQAERLGADSIWVPEFWVDPVGADFDERLDQPAASLGWSGTRPPLRQ